MEAEDCDCEPLLSVAQLAVDPCKQHEVPYTVISPRSMIYRSPEQLPEACAPRSLGPRSRSTKPLYWSVGEAGDDSTALFPCHHVFFGESVTVVDFLSPNLVSVWRPLNTLRNSLAGRGFLLGRYLQSCLRSAAAANNPAERLCLYQSAPETSSPIFCVGSGLFP